MLYIPLQQYLSPSEILGSHPNIAKAYANANERTVKRDLGDLVASEYLLREGKKYQANLDKLVTFKVG